MNTLPFSSLYFQVVRHLFVTTVIRKIIIPRKCATFIAFLQNGHLESFPIYVKCYLPTEGPYDFCDVKIADRIMESIHKNRIYCVMRNVTEFVKFGWMHQDTVSAPKSKHDMN